MTKLLVWVGLLMTPPACWLHAQTPPQATQHFPADTVKRVIDELTQELSRSHPGFYRYNTKAEFTRYIDSVKSTITDSLAELAVYGKLLPIVAKIHCVHTGLSLPLDYTDFLNQQANLLPLQLYFVDNKAYIVNNYSANQTIGIGEELVSINGRSIAKIKNELFALIPADGYNLTFKYRALFYQFPSWYRLIDLTDTFHIVTKQNNTTNTYHLPAATFASLVRDGFLREPRRANQLEFRIEANVGILTIHSFAKTAITQAHQKFKPFIDQAFRELKRGHVPALIVDLRDNTGGTDAYAAYFSRYFFDQPFRYWDRIEVTEAIANQIKGLVLRAFYKRPLQRDSIWLWQGARHTTEFDFYKTQQPTRNNYKGKTYILINGFCVSSCGDVTAVLSANQKAVFIGEETGGGYQGNNSGMLPKTTVAPFNFRMTVPLQKYVNSVDTVKHVGRGTLPALPLTATVGEVLSGLDKPLEYAIELARRNTLPSQEK